MTTALRVSFCFFCDGHLWCQVSRILKMKQQQHDIELWRARKKIRVPDGIKKFQEHCFNISRDIVYSVFTTFRLQYYDIISDLICKIEKRQYL